MSNQNKLEGVASLLGSSSIYLQSEKFYDDLNQKIEDSRGYRAYCDSLNHLNKGTAFRIYCAQLVKYLKTKYTTPNGQNNEYDDCTLLNYWIYGKLVQFYGSDKKPIFFQASGQLQEIWSRVVPYDSNTSSNNICKPIIFDIYNQDDWYKRKEFYDYCVDYKTLKDTANLFDSVCEAYYMYIESKIPVYEYIKKLCTQESANTCPNFYKQCKECDPKKLLSELNCHEAMQEKKTAREKEMATQPVVTHPDQGADSALTGRAGLPDPSQKSQVSSSAVTNASNAFLGVVVTSMTSGFLYKFTPLGTHLRNRFGYNRNAISSIHRGDNELFDYATESFNPYPGGEEHYIGYHPA
ncbi:PIR protein [Plasmodium vivax]|uniref:VIR protein n=1 Tax=Plasmodium vivax TaxID=5855 RepID=A0A565A4V5_PLAVI|nr:PIR protein [Plasmodium vivax]